jgi:mRNA interferase MazF
MVAASSINPTYARGDAILCDLNLVVGTEQAGTRPVVILQIDRACDRIRILLLN